MTLDGSESRGSSPRHIGSGQDGPVPVIDVLLPDLEAHPQGVAGAASMVGASIIRAVTASGWPGVVLPATLVTTAQVYPVVRILEAAHTRISRGQGPELDGRVLERWEADAAAETGPPVHVVGFVADGRGALDRVRRMRGFGAGLVTARRTTQWQAWEADAASTWLVHDDGTKAQVVVAGRRGPVHTARRQVGTRLVEERLFGHAIACGLLSGGR